MSETLAGKRVVILGLARQGTALAKWLCEVGARVTISDLRHHDQLVDSLDELDDLDITYVLGEHPEWMLDGADLLCLSGGVPIDAPIVREARSRGVRLSNDAQLFMERCPCHVIGITGSAGKTTTTSLVGAMCDASGKLAWVGGNIGNPLIADLPYIRPDDVVVMELSSFQLEIMTASPHIAAILNVTPNHLDRHRTMEAYLEAKARILSAQVVGDVAVLGLDDPLAASVAGRAEHDVVYFSGRSPVDVGAWLVNDTLVCRPRFDLPMEKVCTISDINLRGYHNVLNTLAACAIAGAAGVPIPAMTEAIRKFQAVEHRLEVVREVDGVTWINDSIATAPERVIAALRAYSDRPVVLLLGGRDKKLPWDDLAMLAIQVCRAIITFGEAAPMIARTIGELRDAQGRQVPIEIIESLSEAVQIAAEVAQPGDVVLLSPGATSYDAYLDFAARGAHFKQIVGQL